MSKIKKKVGVRVPEYDTITEKTTIKTPSSCTCTQETKRLDCKTHGD